MSSLCGESIVVRARADVCVGSRKANDMAGCKVKEDLPNVLDHKVGEVWTSKCFNSK